MMTLNKLIRSLFFSICVCCCSTLCQMLCSIIVLGIQGKPEFVTPTLILISFFMKTMFAIAYVLMGCKIPIKNPKMRAFTYMMLIWASDYIPQVLGLAGADGPIAEKSFSIPIIICDSLVYLFAGWLLGIIFKDQPVCKERYCEKSTYMKTIISSAFLFPLLVILTDQILGRVYSPFGSAAALQVSLERRHTFYAIFYCMFILSGALLTIFYRLTEYNSNDPRGWIRFSMIYSLLIWTPVVLIMIAFGTNIIPTIVYAFLFILCILIVSLFIGKLMKGVSCYEGKDE